MAPPIGSLAWAKQTGGRMSFGDRVGELTRAAVFQLRVLPAQIRYALGFERGGPARIDAQTLKLPDSKVAQVSELACREVLTPSLVNHCLRSYVWARIFAARDSIAFDEELLYVACLLHDLGLAEEHFATCPGASCFALHGAAAARQLVDPFEWPPERSEALEAAIALHLNVRVSVADGPEAHLLNAGAAVDVVGVRAWDLRRSEREQVVETFPRLGFKQEVDRLWNHQATQHRGTRAEFLTKYLGFRRRIQRAPFQQ